MDVKKSLTWQFVLPAIGVSILTLGLLTWIVPNLVKQNAERESASAAENTVSQLKAIRAYYTGNVVNKVLGKGGLKASINHANEPDSIPLPATMIHDLSALLKEKGTDLKLYSAFPFPNRQSRQLDSFQKEAWKAITASPEQT